MKRLVTVEENYFRCFHGTRAIGLESSAPFEQVTQRRLTGEEWLISVLVDSAARIRFLVLSRINELLVHRSPRSRRGPKRAERRCVLGRRGVAPQQNGNNRETKRPCAWASRNWAG